VNRLTLQQVNDLGPGPLLMASDRMTTPCEPKIHEGPYGSWDEDAAPSAVVVWLDEYGLGCDDTQDPFGFDGSHWYYATADENGKQIVFVDADEIPVDAFRSAIALARSIGRAAGKEPVPVLWIDPDGVSHDLRDTAAEWLATHGGKS
jgi:hypothetical protein